MRVQEMVLDNDSRESQDLYEHHFSSMSKYSRSDVRFPPLSTPRRRAPSITSIQDLNTTEQPRGQSVGVLTIKASNTPLQEMDQLNIQMQDDSDMHEPEEADTQDQHSEIEAEPPNYLEDLPLEVQGRILDHIFGDMHSIYAGSTSLRGKSVSSLMRHPRRKAVSDLALVSASWRELVQERIYRHIKIKGTRTGLDDSKEYFVNHLHLTKHVRHIEFWVPVWGDKAAFDNRSLDTLLPGGNDRAANLQLAHQANDGLFPANDLLGFGFKLSAYSATLSQIFSHIACFFPEARVFTLEGGHCKKSNMIRHFPKILFSPPNQALEPLPNIRTFAMRGAWNIMREHKHWKNLERALPNVEEWHCGYAKPRPEADMTINDILYDLPTRFRHVNISLDGMYSKDPTTLGSSFFPVGGQPHLCERLGGVLPDLESLSFTGKICECMWGSALSRLQDSSRTNQPPRLKALEIVVKSCCRQRVTEVDPETGETVTHELGGIIADGAGITNLVFIRAFERLVLATVEALPFFPSLEYVRIRFIDLDSPCTLLNPYWQLEGGRVYGIWNEEIVERLGEVRPGVFYEELGDGIEYSDWTKGHGHGGSRGGSDDIGSTPGSTANHSSALSNNNNTGSAHGNGNGNGGGGSGSTCSLYPKWKPRSIKTSSYKIIAEARGA